MPDHLAPIKEGIVMLTINTLAPQGHALIVDDNAILSYLLADLLRKRVSQAQRFITGKPPSVSCKQHPSTW